MTVNMSALIAALAAGNTAEAARLMTGNADHAAMLQQSAVRAAYAAGTTR